MSSIFLIALANIKRRKLQSLMIGICLALATLLFATTLGLFQGMHKPFDQLFDQLKASHLLLFYDQQQQETEPFIQWFKHQPEVETVSAGTPYFTLEEPLIFKGEEIDLMVQLTEHQEENADQDQVLILKGEKKAHPALGEIWIPNHLASNHGILIGDTLGIPTQEGLFPLVVSAMVVDPHYASSLFNPTRAWLAPGSLPFFLPISQLNGRMLGIRTNTPDEVAPLWSRFTQTHYFDGEVLKYSLFKSAFLSFYQIISLVLLIFSMLAIFVAMFILYTTLNGAITSDMRLIGIYKTLGFTPGNIVMIYFLQYNLLAALSLPVGILGSYFLTNTVLVSLIQSIGLVNLNYSFYQPFTIAAGLVLALVALLTLLGSFRAGKIKPVDAIRTDPRIGAYSKTPFSKPFIQTRISIPFFLAMRMLLANPPRLVYTALSLFISIFILIFSINISHSFSGLKDNKPAWGLEDSDILIRLNKKIALPLDHESFLESIQNNESVAVVVPYSYCSGTIPASSGTPPQELVGKVYTAAMESIGLTNLTGQHPQKEDDIALCLLTAKEHGKQVGDSLELFIEGQQKGFYITGIYQDVSNLGRGFRLAGPAMIALYPPFEPQFYALRLKLGVPVAQFRDSLEKAFAETILIELGIEERKGIQNTVASMRSSVVLVSLIFLLILFTILFNTTLMNIHQFRRSFGIFKTVGMGAFQIRRALVYNVLIITLICLLSGVPLALLLSPILISDITEGIGLKNFPYLIDYTGSILTLPAMLLFTGCCAWWASKSILKITPKDLVSG